MILRLLYTIALFIGPAMAMSQNLILNPSFESNGDPYCESWIDGCGNKLSSHCDSMWNCNTRLIMDTPQATNTGDWGVQVYGSIPTSGSVTTYITGMSGTLVYQLKFWMNTTFFLGEAYLGPVENGVVVDSNSISDHGEGWQQYTLLDTITTEFNDSIGVVLTAGLGDFCICIVSFDQIELTVIDTLGTSSNDEVDNSNFHVYPNPFSDNITIEVPFLDNYQIAISDISGKLIRLVSANEKIVNVDLSTTGDGLYFYTILNADTQAVMGRGKIVKGTR